MRTKSIKAFTLRHEGDKWYKTYMKIVRNPEMSNTEVICFGWTCSPLRGRFSDEGWCRVVVNENGIPIIVPGEVGDEVLIIPEYMEMDSLNGVSLEKPFQVARGLKYYNYKKVEKHQEESTEVENQEK